MDRGGGGGGGGGATNIHLYLCSFALLQPVSYRCVEKKRELVQNTHRIFKLFCLWRANFYLIGKFLSPSAPPLGFHVFWMSSVQLHRCPQSQCCSSVFLTRIFGKLRAECKTRSSWRQRCASRTLCSLSRWFLFWQCSVSDSGLADWMVRWFWEWLLRIFHSRKIQVGKMVLNGEEKIIGIFVGLCNWIFDAFACRDDLSDRVKVFSPMNPGAQITAYNLHTVRYPPQCSVY